METVQEESVMHEKSLLQDEGYCGSQETKLCLENSEDNFMSYFNEQPNLNDCSFHIMCAEASGFPDQTQDIIFKDL